jgi:hypothetical protein
MNATRHDMQPRKREGREGKPRRASPHTVLALASAFAPSRLRGSALGRIPAAVLAVLISLQLAFVLGVARAEDVAAPAPAGASPFRYLDVIIDTGGKPLAAYQFELVAPKGVQLVGIEGGEHKAFAHPPYYDPKALVDGERIVIAAFDTGAELPSGKTRVARLSVRVADGQAKPEYHVTLQVAASSDAKPIEGGTVSISEGAAQ